MNLPSRCDVVVIGGGPAGSIAGTMLAQKGYDVVLIEKQKHPRYQVGESLIPDFWKYTDKIGATEKIEAEGFIAKAGGLINWKRQPRAHNFSDFGYSRPALHVERDRFDYILIDHARSEGVGVFEEVAVSSVDLNRDADGYVTVSYKLNGKREIGSIACRYVLDASGQSAVISRQLGTRQIDPDFRFMSVWGYFKNSKYFSYDGVAYPAEKVREIPPTTYVTSLDETGDAGWCWHIKLRENTSVGLVMAMDVLREHKDSAESWESYFLRRLENLPVVCDLLKDAEYIEDSLHITRDYSYNVSEVAGPGYFLLGDASGFVDPIFSVGCVMSCYSAYAAVWAVDRCLKNPESEAQNQALYTKQLKGRIEIARSLALPRYSTQGETSELAKTALKLQRNDVQDLMQVVSTLTSRSDNYHKMVDANGKEAVKMKTYEKLEVGA